MVSWAALLKEQSAGAGKELQFDTAATLEAYGLRGKKRMR